MMSDHPSGVVSTRDAKSGMLAAGATPYEAALIANYAAGVEVGKLGAATVSPDEILEAWQHHNGT